jgi:hypothetical protein
LCGAVAGGRGAGEQAFQGLSLLQHGHRLCRLLLCVLDELLLGNGQPPDRVLAGCFRLEARRVLLCEKSSNVDPLSASLHAE